MDSSIRAAPLNTLQDDDDAPSASRSASECVRQRMCPPHTAPRRSHMSNRLRRPGSQFQAWPPLRPAGEAVAYDPRRASDG